MAFTLGAAAGWVPNLPVEAAGGYQPNVHTMTPGDLSFQRAFSLLACRGAGSHASHQ